jgi:hypothetical protein
MKRLLIPAACLALAACADVTPDPATTARIQKDIVQACLSSGLFKMATGAVTMVVPAATLPIDVLNAGVNVVCADPARFANDASTVEWVIKNLATHKTS